MLRCLRCDDGDVRVSKNPQYGQIEDWRAIFKFKFNFKFKLS